MDCHDFQRVVVWMTLDCESASDIYVYLQNTEIENKNEICFQNNVHSDMVSDFGCGCFHDDPQRYYIYYHDMVFDLVTRNDYAILSTFPLCANLYVRVISEILNVIVNPLYHHPRFGAFEDSHCDYRFSTRSKQLQLQNTVDIVTVLFSLQKKMFL